METRITDPEHADPLRRNLLVRRRRNFVLNMTYDTPVTLFSFHLPFNR